jgi:hypothetical protein
MISNEFDGCAMRLTLACLALAMLAGCSGQYYVTVPDQVAPVGKEATAVVRLERHEFAGWRLPLKEAPVQFRVEQGPPRGAYTDQMGYAAASVPVGKTPGRFYLNVFHPDRSGDEVSVYAPVYVWDATMLVTAVDLDGLPLGGKDVDAARTAINKIACNSYIVYFTQRPVKDHALAHEQLKTANFPDGAILLWQQEAWHFVNEGSMNMPRLVLEDRLVNPIARLKRDFPELRTAICSNELAAKAFAGAGIKAVIIGQAKVNMPNVVNRKSWADLATAGL